MKRVVHHGKDINTPKIVGKKIDKAKRFLKSKNLFLEITAEKYNNDFPKGTIITQNPRANISTKANRTIEVTLSKGAKLATIPSLSNQTVNEAKVILKSNGFLLGKIEHRYSADVVKGKIIKSNPLTGESTPLGTKIELFVSLGELPDSQNESNKYYDLLND